MAIIAFLGSFPNSQVRPRKATATQMTNTVAVPLAPATAIVVAANPDRTALTIKNSGSTVIRYGYSVAEINPGTGFILPPGASIDIEEPGDVYATADVGAGSLSYDEGVG